MKSSLSFEKVWFVLSLMVLSFLYGAGVGKWEWFPHSLLKRAVDQGRELMATESEPPGVPQVYDRSGVRVVEPEEVQPGPVLITSSWRWGKSDDLKPGVKLIDRTGETLHAWHPDRSELFQGPGLKGRDPQKALYHGSLLLPNGNVLLNLSRVGLVQLDACGRVVWRVEEGNHHSIAQAEDGSFWTPGTSSERRERTSQYPDGFPGIDGPIWLEQIVHVSRGGDVLEKINVLDILYNNDLERYISKADQPQAGTEGPLWKHDISHINDVEPLPSSVADEYPMFETGDLLVSLRNLDLVFVFDPESGDVKWHASDPFIQQHDPDFIGGGWIGVFDNNEDFTERGQMLGGSRIVALQPHTDSVRILFPTRHSEPFYTDIRGKWQKLGNGNMLLTESNAGRVVEVASDGRTVWEWIHQPIGQSRVSPVMGATRYGLTQAEVASWLCSSVDS